MRARVDVFPMDGGIVRTWEGELVTDPATPDLVGMALVPYQIKLVKPSGDTVVIVPGTVPYAITLYTGTK